MLFSLLPLLVAGPASAATLEIGVDSDPGSALGDAVVSAVPLSSDGEPVAASAPVSGVQAMLAQRGHRFVPFVLPIRRGTEVLFPNYDDTRHHVYSFAEIRPFEIQLYKGDPDTTITFDRAGVAAVGCNIHDYMQAFVFVTDAPYFGVTDGETGTLSLELPPGRYRLSAWHPWQGAAVADQEVEVRAATPVQARFRFDLSPPPPRRPVENALQKWIQSQ
ncbi:MAG TPA: methylamine utilization protein [Pseudomonadales bacterium]|nr:methylamine utilization protein [Pseudomonadales bacterium]